MANIAELLVKIGADSSGLRKELAASQRQLKRAFGPEALSLSKGAVTLLAGLATAAGLAGAAAVKMSADFAASKTAFTTLLGSAEKAEKMLSDLQRFAADTPFELPGLTKSAQKLLAFGFAAQDIIPIMSAVGNAIALVGGGQEAIDGVIRALAQIQAKGKLSAEEMNQLSERGINGWKYIADAMGISIAEVMDLSQKGAINATTAINAVVSGMEKNFVGGMEAMSKTVPGLLSTIKDNAGMVMKEIGDSITAGLDLQSKLKGVADYLTQFATVVKSAGIKEAIMGMVPPEVTASIFALGGVITGVITAVAIPALRGMAGAALLALAPFAKFIIIGAAVGAVAYEIWKNWEPLKELFSELWGTVSTLISDYCGIIKGVINDAFGWAIDFIVSGHQLIFETAGSVWDGITGFVGDAWDRMKSIVADGVAWIADAMQPLLDLIGKAMPDGVKNLFANLAGGIARVKKAASKLDFGFSKVDISKYLGDGSKVNTKFNGLSGGGTGPGAGSGGGGSSGKDLAKEAERISEAIEREWVQTTKTQMQQLEIWKADQLQALEETAAANENYERDKERVAATYSVRRQKILQQEAATSEALYQKIAEGYTKMQDEISSYGLKGSAKGYADIEKEQKDRMKSVADFYKGIQQQFVVADDATKSEILVNLDERGIAYRLTEQGNLDFTAARQADMLAILKQTQSKRIEMEQNCADVRADIEAAYNANSLSMLQNTLTAANATRLNDYAAQQALMQTYQEAFLASHMTIKQALMTTVAEGFKPMKSAISDMITGAKTIGEAFSAMGQAVLKSIADIVAGWIAGQLTMMAINAMSSMLGLKNDKKQLANSVASGAATAAAWAPAAAMVSLATMGANAGPAMLGIAATTGVAMLLSGAGAAATGGYQKGPGTGTSDSILSWLSNGEYVIQASAVKKFGVGLFNSLNAGYMPAFADGGLTTGPSLSAVSMRMPSANIGDVSMSRALNKTGASQAQEAAVFAPQIHLNVQAIDAKGTSEWLRNTGTKLIIKSLREVHSEFGGI